jgi:transposase
VQEVSVDMWGGFAKVIREAFPNAVVVFDRFHVMKLVNQELNQLRKKAGVTTKESKYLLLKNNADLDDEQRQKLAVILSQSSCLSIAYELKEEFRAIYETSRSVKAGQRRIQKRLNQAQVLYRDSTPSIRAHLDGICNYFISHAASGVMEGINTRIKLIMRQGYEFTNFDNFRARLFACFSD